MLRSLCQVLFVLRLLVHPVLVLVLVFVLCACVCHVCVCVFAFFCIQFVFT